MGKKDEAANAYRAAIKAEPNHTEAALALERVAPGSSQTKGAN
jgi:hypothetical protein